MSSDLFEHARRIYFKNDVNRHVRAKSPKRRKLQPLVNDNGTIYFVGDEPVPARTIEQRLEGPDEIIEEDKYYNIFKE